MSQQVTEAHIRQYKDNVTLMYQQSDHRLAGTTQVRSLTGESDFWDRIGPTAMTDITTRHAATPHVDTPHSRRMCVMTDKAWSDKIDKQDKIRMLIDPQSSYVRNAVMAANRAKDDIIIASFAATASTGKLGDGTITFDADWPNGNRAAGQGDEDFSGAAIDIDDLLTLQKQFDENDVPDEDRHILMTPGGFTQLLTSTEVSSSDYNTVKTLVQGQIDTFLGFKFHKISTKRMTVATGTDFYCYAWHRDAIGVSMGMDLFTEVSILPTHNYLTQVYVALSLGAVRIQGEGVIRFLIDNAA